MSDRRLGAFSDDPERAWLVYGRGAVRVRLQRSRSRQHLGVARTVSGRRSLLADSHIVAVQRVRYGDGRLDWRPAVRLLRSLHAGLRDRRWSQHDQLHDHWRACVSAQPNSFSVNSFDRQGPEAESEAAPTLRGPALPERPPQQASALTGFR